MNVTIECTQEHLGLKEMNQLLKDLKTRNFEENSFIFVVLIRKNNVTQPSILIKSMTKIRLFWGVRGEGGGGHYGIKILKKCAVMRVSLTNIVIKTE